MSNVTAALPRKSLTAGESQFLKQGNRLLLDKKDGRIGSAALMDIVADWGASRATLPFQEYARLWIAQGGAKNKIANKLLRELFGMDEPTPRKVA
ncbi:hypothetical protein ATI14_1751 [Pseudomonas tolaasii NCPPB 2192]|uniref:Uncharacterized protein n=1 Tax=Pseudomonas tolaasii NCPPB 2192 TaxID=564423 RepID=A0ABX4QDL8_PSETO|nr:hypothetical protein [Pseudomonas tolaasii]ARB29719.1 hypothetical protein B5P22_21280 [Pseudomonas tolaasii]KAB0468475.1 hypothetical protein F7R12_22970 [Pseudomonas tolaasii]NWC29973.1 hypothetical protein [Pseudomonas tolaasii]PKA74900.1 hypothetical protein ATI14_1751 [Pseudomonas tolaasii NCPPB 2192]